MEVLSKAIDQVYQLKANVNQAVLPGAACTDCLQRAQQQIQGLQLLSARLQELTAAAQHASLASAEQQPSQQPPGGGWEAAARQQGQLAAAALQRQVQASVASPRPGLRCPAAALPWPSQLSSGPAPEEAWRLLLQRVCAAAPQLRLHMFKDGSTLLCSVAANNPLRHVPNCKYADEVRVVCAGVFVASVALEAPGQLQAVRVCVDSVDKVSSIDPWSTPKHQVFRRISLLAVKALHHFQQLEAAQALLEPPSPAAAAVADPTSSSAAGDAGDVGAAAAAGGGGDTAGVQGSTAGASAGRMARGLGLECLLLWLAAYEDLFSRPCDVSGKVVAWAPASNVPLPPLVRPYWLSLEELAAAASSRTARRAYAAHLAPWPRAGPPTGTGAAAPAAGEGQPTADATHTSHGVGGVSDMQLLEPEAEQAASLLVEPVTDEQLREQLQQVVGDVF